MDDDSPPRRGGYEGSSVKWGRPPSPSMGSCEICDKPTRSHFLLLEAGALSKTLCVICHECFEDHEGSPEGVLEAVQQQREEEQTA